MRLSLGTLFSTLFAALACGGTAGVDPVAATVVAGPDEDGHITLSAPGYSYPSTGLLALSEGEVVLSVGHREATTVLAVPKGGGATRRVGLPGENVHALVVHQGQIWIGTEHGLKRATDKGFERVGPRDLEVRAMALEGDQAWILAHEAVVAVSLTDGSVRRLGELPMKVFDGAITFDEGSVYVAVPHASTGVSRYPKAGGPPVQLSEKGLHGAQPIAVRGAELVVPSSIGPAVRMVPLDGSPERELPCPAHAGFRVWGDLAYAGRRVAHIAREQRVTSGNRTQSMMTSTESGSGGLFRCDLVTGQVSENLAPASIAVTAIAADDSGVYWFDPERGLVLALKK